MKKSKTTENAQQTLFTSAAQLFQGYEKQKMIRHLLELDLRCISLKLCATSINLSCCQLNLEYFTEVVLLKAILWEIFNSLC